MTAITLEMSQDLKNAIRLSAKRQYEIAREAGINHATLSKLMNNIIELRAGSKSSWNVVAVGRVMGFAPEDCFK